MNAGNILILNFHGDKGYLCREKALTLAQCGIPGSYTKFVNPASWVLRVVAWIPDENRIYAEIEEYKTVHTAFPEHQVKQKEAILKIDIISYRKIDTSGLLRTARGGSEGKVTQSLIADELRDSEPVNGSANIYAGAEIINLSFKYPIKDLQFRLGFVSFSKFIKKLNKTIEFRIQNHELRTEFDAVKNYFANKLGTKRIFVSAELEITGKELIRMSVSSPEIEKINKQFIESVKFEFVERIPKLKNWKPDKSLFTPDEVYDLMTNQELQANPFGDTEDLLIENLLNIHQTKHYKNLRFLASNHLYRVMKLRFVLKPFSFIFLLEGKKKYHIIWETLDTEEATYMWQCDKNLESLKLQLNEIEHIINIVKVQGKTAYLQSDLLKCRRIYHDYSNLIDGFLRWKAELESVLI